MEYNSRRSRWGQSSRQKSSQNYVKQPKFNDQAEFKNRINSLSNSSFRPYSSMSKKFKCNTTRNSLQQSSLGDIMFKQQKETKKIKVQAYFHSNRLSLTENSFVFEEDAFKLQNLISGGYCCDQQFMSLNKFNRTKDNFVLLQQIYNKAKVHPKVVKFAKQAKKSRNIFSVIYLNQNLKNMGKKQTNAILKQLKIAR